MHYAGNFYYLQYTRSTYYLLLLFFMKKVGVYLNIFLDKTAI